MENASTINSPSASQSKTIDENSFWGVGMGGGVGGVVLMTIVYIIYKLILKFRLTEGEGPQNIGENNHSAIGVNNQARETNLDEQRIIEIIESHMKPHNNKNVVSMIPINCTYKKGKSQSDELQTSYSDEENVENLHTIKTKKIDTLKTIRKYKKC